MTKAKIEIRTDGAFSKVFIDGNEVRGVRSYSLAHKAGELPSLQLDLTALDVTVDGVMGPMLPTIFQPFYELRKSD